MATPLQSEGELLQTVFEVIMASTFFKWALLLFIVLFIASLVSGLIDVAIVAAQYGLIVLLALGVLEFIAPGILQAVLEALPIYLPVFCHM